MLIKLQKYFKFIPHKLMLFVDHSETLLLCSPWLCRSWFVRLRNLWE